MLYSRTEHSRGFFTCVMIKNPIISPCIRLNFQTELYFPSESKRVNVASVMYCSPTKHATIGQSQSLLELFKYFDWLTKRQLSITNWTSTKLSVSSSFSGFREKNDTFKVRSCGDLTFLPVLIETHSNNFS